MGRRPGLESLFSSSGVRQKDAKALGLPTARPPNAFKLFCADYQASCRGKSLKEALQEAGQLWKALPETVAAASGSPCKAQYKQAADALMAEYVARVEELFTANAAALQVYRCHRRPLTARVLFRQRLQQLREHEALQGALPRHAVLLTSVANRIYGTLPQDVLAAFERLAAEDLVLIRRLKEAVAGLQGGRLLQLEVLSEAAEDSECKEILVQLEKLHESLAGVALPDAFLKAARPTMEAMAAEWEAGEEDRRCRRVKSRIQNRAGRAAAGGPAGGRGTAKGSRVPAQRRQRQEEAEDEDEASECSEGTVMTVEAAQHAATGSAGAGASASAGAALLASPTDRLHQSGGAYTGSSRGKRANIAPRERAAASPPEDGSDSRPAGREAAGAVLLEEVACLLGGARFLARESRAARAAKRARLPAPEPPGNPFPAAEAPGSGSLLELPQPAETRREAEHGSASEQPAALPTSSGSSPALGSAHEAPVAAAVAAAAGSAAPCQTAAQQRLGDSDPAGAVQVSKQPADPCPESLREAAGTRSGPAATASAARVSAAPSSTSMRVGAQVWLAPATAPSALAGWLAAAVRGRAPERQQGAAASKAKPETPAAAAAAAAVAVAVPPAGEGATAAAALADAAAAPQAPTKDAAASAGPQQPQATAAAAAMQYNSSGRGPGAGPSSQPIRTPQLPPRRPRPSHGAYSATLLPLKRPGGIARTAPSAQRQRSTPSGSGAVEEAATATGSGAGAPAAESLSPALYAPRVPQAAARLSPSAVTSPLASCLTAGPCGTPQLLPALKPAAAAPPGAAVSAGGRPSAEGTPTSQSFGCWEAAMAAFAAQQAGSSKQAAAAAAAAPQAGRGSSWQAAGAGQARPAASTRDGTALGAGQLRAAAESPSPAAEEPPRQRCTPAAVSSAVARLLGWCGLQPKAEPCSFSKAAGCQAAVGWELFDEVQEFHKFLELCLPPSNSCPAAVVIVDARCGAAAPGSQLLLEAIALPRQPPSGAGGQRNIAARVVLAAQDLFRPLPGVLAAADICVVAWAGAASFYACHRTSLQRGPAAAAAQCATAAPPRPTFCANPLISAFFRSALAKGDANTAAKPSMPKLLQPFLGMSCLRLLDSTSGPLPPALALGLLAPPSLHVPPPPRSVVGSAEHAQTMLQAVAGQLAAGIAGAAAWGLGSGACRGTSAQSRDGLAQALEASLRMAGNEVDDLHSLANIPGLAAIAAATERGIAIVGELPQSRELCIVLFSRKCGGRTVLHLSSPAQLGSAPRELLHPRTVVLVWQGPGQFVLCQRSRRAGLPLPHAFRQQQEQPEEEATVAQGVSLAPQACRAASEALQCLEPFPSQCGPPAGPTPSRPGLVAALLPPTTAAWPPDSQPLSVSELLAVLGCTDTRGSGQVGGGVLDALDEALELELVAHWPAVRLGREKAYRTRVAAWRRQRCQEAFVAAGGMAVPGPGDELIAQALDSARDMSELSSCQELLHLARALQRPIALFEAIPSSQPGPNRPWQLVLFPAGRTSHPHSFLVERRRDVPCQVFDVLRAPGTLCLLWSGRGCCLPALRLGGKEEPRAIQALLTSSPALQSPLGRHSSFSSQLGSNGGSAVHWLLHLLQHCPLGPPRHSLQRLAFEGQLLQRLLPGISCRLTELERHIITSTEPQDFLDLETHWPLRAAAMDLGMDVIILEPPVSSSCGDAKPPSGTGDSPGGGACSDGTGSGNCRGGAAPRRAIRFPEEPPAGDEMLAGELFDLGLDSTEGGRGMESGSSQKLGQGQGTHTKLWRQSLALRLGVTGVWAGGDRLKPWDDGSGEAAGGPGAAQQPKPELCGPLGQWLQQDGLSGCWPPRQGSPPGTAGTAGLPAGAAADWDSCDALSAA